MDKIKEYLAAIGRKGGRKTSPAKRAAAQANARKPRPGARGSRKTKKKTAD